ncbi:MAG: ABC transporter ATP-binding protein [Clostridia bacterium]|nr:ABC transporter ATP-binding protein [Clostridia bacterium]
MKRWLSYVKPYTLYFVLGPLLMIVEVIGEVLMPMYLGQILNEASEGTLNTPRCFMYICLMILTALMMMAGGVGGAYFGTKASVNYAADVRRDVYRKVQKFSFANIDKFSTGSLVTRLTNDVTQIQNFINTLLRMCMRSPGIFIGALIMAIRLRPQLSWIFAISVPVLAVIIGFIIKTAFPRFGIMQEKVDKLNSTVQESVTNVRVVKSFVREDYEIDKFTEANGNLKASGISAMKIIILNGPVMTLFMNITVAAIIWFGAHQVMGITDTMAPGDLSQFITYANQILNSLMMLSMMFMMSSRAIASGRRISEVLDEKVDISDEYASQKDMTVTNGSIEFKDVTFRYYKNSEDSVLEKINLTIPAGKTVGIIGSTGCGKTTLVSLIPRLYDTDEGEVLVDGVNVRDYSLRNLREGVGMVLQKNVLFSGTIEDNLRWGDEDATMKEIIAAADSAQADTFIKNFKDGYQTELEQGGVNVSGGQKQRLCIARALLKKPKILILDDSTSAVDTATEARIREEFRTGLKDSTKIIIAQRIMSVMEADMIVVMNDGQITGVGTHDELMKTNTEYQEIYASQMESKEKEA